MTIAFDKIQDFALQVSKDNSISLPDNIISEFQDNFSDLLISSTRQLQIWKVKPSRLSTRVNNFISLHSDSNRELSLISNRVRQMTLCAFQKELFIKIQTLCDSKWNKVWTFHELRKYYPAADTFFRRTFSGDSISKRNMKLFLSAHSEDFDDIYFNYVPRKTNQYTDVFLRNKFAWFLEAQLWYWQMSDLIHFFDTESLWRTIYQKIKWGWVFSIKQQKNFLNSESNDIYIDSIDRFVWRWSEDQIQRILNQYLSQDSVSNWSPDKLKHWRDVNWYKIWNAIVQALRSYTFSSWEDWLYVLVKLMDQKHFSKKFYYNRSQYYWSTIKDSVQINGSYEYISNIDDFNNGYDSVMLPQEITVSVSQMRDLLWDNYQSMLNSINSGEDIDPKLLKHARSLMKLE